MNLLYFCRIIQLKTINTYHEQSRSNPQEIHQHQLDVTNFHRTSYRCSVGFAGAIMDWHRHPGQDVRQRFEGHRFRVGGGIGVISPHFRFVEKESSETLRR